mmetsp:Transcript_21855/g.37516  ORF Transcript_21855/g.37516 Transcript_21855/m.37516 type:complete len:536 (-) Transcript_21855:393-2000(-)
MGKAKPDKHHGKVAPTEKENLEPSASALPSGFAYKFLRFVACGGVLSCGHGCLAVCPSDKNQKSKTVGGDQLLPAGTLSSSATNKDACSEAKPFFAKMRKLFLWFCLSIMNFAIIGTYQALVIEIWPHHVEDMLGSDNPMKSFVTGTYTGVLGLSGLIAAPIAGKIGDKTGHRRRIAFFGVLVGIVFIMMACLWTPERGWSVWTLIPTIVGLNFGLNSAVVMTDSLIPAVLPMNEITGCNMMKGVFQVLGETSGQLAISFVIMSDPNAFYSLYAIPCVILFVCVLFPVFGTRTKKPETAKAAAEQGQLESPSLSISALDLNHSKNRWLMVIGRFFLMGAVFSFTSFLSYMWEDVFGMDGPGQSELYAAFVTVAISVAGLVGVFVGGRSAEKFSPKWPVQLAAIGVIVGMGVMSLGCYYLNVASIFIGAVVAGVGWGANISSEQVLMVHCAPSKFQMGADFGLLSAATNLGALICPTASGFIIFSMVSKGLTYQVAMIVVFMECVFFAALSFLLTFFVTIPKRPAAEDPVPIQAVV